MASGRMETRLEDKRNMRRQEITQGWTLQVQGEKERIPAQVPGSVYYDLLRTGWKIPSGGTTRMKP